MYCKTPVIQVSPELICSEDLLILDYLCLCTKGDCLELSEEDLAWALKGKR